MVIASNYFSNINAHHSRNPNHQWKIKINNEKSKIQFRNPESGIAIPFHQSQIPLLNQKSSILLSTFHFQLYTFLIFIV